MNAFYAALVIEESKHQKSMRYRWPGHSRPRSRGGCGPLFFPFSLQGKSPGFFAGALVKAFG